MHRVLGVDHDRVGLQQARLEQAVDAVLVDAGDQRALRVEDRLALDDAARMTIS